MNGGPLSRLWKERESNPLFSCLVLTRKSWRPRAVVSFVEGEGVEPGPEGHPVFKTGAHPRRPHLPSRCVAKLVPPDRVELSRRVSKTQVGSVRGGIGTSRKNRTFSASFVDQRPVHRWRYRIRVARPLEIESAVFLCEQEKAGVLLRRFVWRVPWKSNPAHSG